MTDTTVDERDTQLANVASRSQITNPRGRLPPVDWARGQKPAWDERIAKDWAARSLATGGTSGG